MIIAEKKSFAVARVAAATSKPAPAGTPVPYRIGRPASFAKAPNGAASYYDGIAGSYDKFYDDVLSQGENAWVRSRLGAIVKKGDRVLDLGCGTGLGFQLLKGSAAEYVGLDVSPGMIAVAREKFGDRAIFALGDMAKMRVAESARFDVAMSLFGSFSHVLEPERAIMAISHACKPGGRIFLMVYSRLSLRNLVRSMGAPASGPTAQLQPYSVRNSQTASGAAMARSYTAHGLKSLFGRFKDVKVVGLNAVFELGLVKSLSRRVVRDSVAAERALSFESRMFRHAPNLCHSLVVTAINMPR